MTLNRVLISAPRGAVWRVLMDPAAYAHWVVGSKRVRGVDSSWPRRGAKFHHTVGTGPAAVRDSTRILLTEPESHLTLEVRFRPAGVAVVDLVLDSIDDDTATAVTMREAPLEGVARATNRRPGAALLRLRNAWSLRRLRRLAEARSVELRSAEA